MKKRMELILRVNKEAGSDKFYKKSQDLGVLAAQAFRGEQERHRSQMTGLEHIAETTFKATDVLDYIKKQTAHQPMPRDKREEPQGWKKKVGPKGELFGQLLKDEIEDGLKTFIDNVCFGFINNATEEGKLEQQEVHLQLIRQLIRQLVARYEYEVSLLEEKART